MIIHSDVLTYRHFEDAAAFAGVKVVEIEQLGSRSRHSKFKFYLAGSSSHSPGFGRTYGDDLKAATWDEWGIFFARLFMLDSQAHCGARSYQNEEHFHWVTGNRFRTLTPRHQHKHHTWGMGQPNITHTYSVAYCTGCSAIQRRLTGGTWEEFQQ